jgi:hypothetical protein
MSSAVSSSPDAYVSMRSGGTRDFNTPQGAGSVLFVDLSAGVELERLRALPATVLREHRATLLIRAEHPDSASELREILERWDLQMAAGLLIQSCGREAQVEALIGQPEVDMARARAIELEALCDWGHAIWRPTRYHYRLPSGEHATSFIKLADAIRSPRDARVLASWLTPHLDNEIGLVVDTGTLTSVVEAVQGMMTRDGMEPGPVSVLDQYPRTGVDVDGAVQLSAGDAGRVLAVLSVNSSGVVRDRLTLALDRQGRSLASRQMVIMIDKGEPSRREDIETWSPLPGRAPLLERGAAARDRCKLCGDQRKSRIIPIDPFSFDGMFQAQLRPTMLSIDDAKLNWQFWEGCNRCKAIAVESFPLVQPPVRSELMSIRVRLDHLIAEPEFRKVVAERLAQPIGDPDEPFEVKADLVLVPEVEHELPGFADFWAGVGQVVAPGQEAVPWGPKQPLDGDELKDRIAKASHVLVFSLGVVSGWSMQRALVAIQHTHSKRDLDLQGLAVHARPGKKREWTTLCNSYGRRLHAGFISVLPERSPLQEEQFLLSNVDADDLDDVDTLALFEERLSLCNGESAPDGEPFPLFYGAGSGAELTRNSVFGSRLDARSTYAAVASAMAAARSEQDEGAPEIRVFDLDGILRSYYDPLILAAFFRWLEPYEAWWGWQAEEAERTISAVLGRADTDDLKILIPELLLARALGKVHDAAFGYVETRRKQLLSTWSGRDRAALDLAGRLVASARTEFADPEGTGPGPSPAAV